MIDRMVPVVRNLARLDDMALQELMLGSLLLNI
jgi:hypothetical protein